MSKNLPPEGTYRTKGEKEAKKKYAEIFENSVFARTPNSI